jgi:NIPSNAP
MPVYEKRTYCITVGRMSDVVRLYTDEGWPVLEAAGFGKNLVGYFISDTGPLHQLIHVWRFDDDSARRDFWQRLYANQAFMAFAAQVRPLIQTQEVQLLVSAPWGPQP